MAKHVAPERLSLAQVARLAPGQPTRSTCWRWMRRGVLARDGTRVRLRHYRAGRRLFTTRADLEEFFLKTAQADVAGFEAEERQGRRTLS